MSAPGTAANLVSAVVAPGRTIVDETGERVGPGGTAKILQADFKELLDEGFIVDRNAQKKAAPVTGPTVSVAAGPSVKRVP